MATYIPDIKDVHVKHFIEHIYNQTSRFDINVELCPTKYIIITDEGNVKVNGYFDESGKVLKCAINKPIKKWLPILVHEYSHFEQWRSQCKSWVAYENSDSEKLFPWIKHLVNLNKEHSDQLCDLTRDLELDCERRTLKNIKKFELPLVIEKYAQQAAAYIYLYNYIKIKRTWYKHGRCPYQMPEILKEMPTTLRGHFKTIPNRIIKLYDQYVF